LFIPRCKGSKFISALTGRVQVILGTRFLLNLACEREIEIEYFAMNSGIKEIFYHKNAMSQYLFEK